MRRILCLWLPNGAAPDDASFSTQREALEQLALHCERYSPLVGLGEAFPRPPGKEPAFDSLLLDVTSIGTLFGGEAQLAEAIRADFAARGHEVRIAIAENVALAWGLAHFLRPPLPLREGWGEGEKSLEKSVHPDQPHALTLTLSQRERGLLPVAALRLSPDHLATLHQLGIATVAQLAALPRSALATRFGVELVRQLDRMEGIVDELIVPVRPPPEFFAEWLLEHPTADRAALAMILEQLAERVGEALRQRDQGAVQLVCRLDIAGHPPRLVEIGLFRPSADARHFMELLRLQGEALELRGEIGRVGLSAVTTARLEHRQQQLFTAERDNRNDDLALLINRLSNRLGRERVARPKLTRDVVPECAYELVPLTAQQIAAAAAAPRKKRLAKQAAQKMMFPEERSAPAYIPPALARPLSLLPQPVALAAVSVAPDGPPISFTWQGSLRRIARHWGPERIETAWWRGASVRRDYYRVETASGERYWLFRELRGGKWFLQGWFG